MKNHIFHGDAAVILNQLPDCSVDAVVTDPPFGIGFDYETQEETRTAADYWCWFAPIYADMKRVLRPGGLMAIWQAQKYFRHFWDWYGDDIHIYAACRNFIQMRKSHVQYAYDPVVLYYKAGAEPLRPMHPPRNCDFFVSNSARYVTDTKAIERGHPCPRPLDAVEEIIRNFVLPGGLVLDPFIGSGTTAVASLNLGRDFCGVEKNAGYYGLCQRRLAQAQSGWLFAFAPSAESSTPFPLA